jgi:VanZ family protein
VNAPEREDRSVRRLALAWLPPLAYMALIWVLSSGPINLPIDKVPFKDKGVHVVEYGTLCVLSASAIRRSWLGLGLLRVLLWAALLTFVWGYLDELHQAFVPGRDSSALDVLADVIGAVAGSACFAAVAWLRGAPMRAQRG